MMNKTKFDHIYKKYSPMLYGVALQLNAEENKAEQIVIGTFKQIFEQDITKEKYPIYCIKLIRISIKTAQDIFPLDQNKNLTLGLFEKSPLLNQVVCVDSSLKDLCFENNIEHKHGFETIRHEFTNIRSLNTEKLLSKNDQIQQLREIH